MGRWWGCSPPVLTPPEVLLPAAKRGRHKEREVMKSGGIYKRGGASASQFAAQASQAEHKGIGMQ